MNHTPSDIDNPNQTNIIDITETPCIKNGYITIGNSNRVNKMSDNYINTMNLIMLECPNIRMLFKTKALINLRIRKEFIEKFDEKVRNRIIVLEVPLTHFMHLEKYNQVDIAIDTFCYSGTTTSCEALCAGVPVLSLYDSVTYLHAQNVTCSILKNSGLDFYICNSVNEIIEKIKILEEKPIEFWKTNKQNVREHFLNGKVCNKKEYVKNVQELFIKLYKHKI